MSTFRFKCTKCGNNRFTIPFLTLYQLDRLEPSGFLKNQYVIHVLIPNQTRILCTDCQYETLILEHEKQ